MKGLILLGGLGTRLRPLTLQVPKPLVPILNRPFISYQLDLLRKFGVREVVLALGHKAGHFRRQLGNGKRFGLRFIYSLEPTALGTGGAIRHALPHMEDTTLVINGDVLAEFDLRAMAKSHARHRADATLAIVTVENPTAYGLVEIDGQGFLKRFVEKPSQDEITSRIINAGCYFLNAAIISSIPAGRPISLEREIFPALLASGRRLATYFHRGYWSDVGTLKSYWKTHMDLLAGRKNPQLRAVGTRLGKGATLEGRVCLGSRVILEAEALVANCVIHDRVHIGARSRVEGAVIGTGAWIGEDCVVGPNAVLAPGARLPSHSQMVNLLE